MTFNVNYTWGHAIDGGSTWHSGATSSNGAGAGEGYTTDVMLPQLDRGNSIFDIRQRLVANYVWELPFFKSQQGFIGHVLGGWQYNGIISWQTGAHWEPWNSNGGSRSRRSPARTTSARDAQARSTAGACVNTGGDYNLDGIRNDRPNATADQFRPKPRSMGQWLGYGSGIRSGDATLSSANGFFTAPCLGASETWDETPSLGRALFLGKRLCSRTSRSRSGSICSSVRKHSMC